MKLNWPMGSGLMIFIYLRSCRGLWHVNFGHENFKLKKFENFSYQLFLVRRAKFITKSISRLSPRQIEITRIDLGGRSNACRGNNLPNVTARTFFLKSFPFKRFLFDLGEEKSILSSFARFNHVSTVLSLKFTAQNGHCI